MNHKIDSVTFYQAVTIYEKKGKGRTAHNTIDEETVKGVTIDREGETIVLNHPDWEFTHYVGMANVRNYKRVKEFKSDFLPEEFIEKLRSGDIKAVNTTSGKKTEALVAKKKAKKKTKKKVTKKK